MYVAGHLISCISSPWKAFVVAGIVLNAVMINGCSFKPRAMDLLEITPEEAAATVDLSVKLVFTVQPINSLRSVAIAPAVQVAVQDKDGNTVTTSKAKITLIVGTNPGNGTLSGNGASSGTVTLEATNGIATFTDLSIDHSGVGYTLSASTNTLNISTNSVLTPATSNLFNITGPPAKLAFVTEPSNTAAGSSISPAVSVEVQDSEGLRVTSVFPTIVLTLSKNPGAGTLLGTVSQTAISGFSLYSDLSIQKAAPGYALTASSNGLTSSVSIDFDILPAAATKLAFEIQPSNTVAGVAINPAVKLIAQDQFNNLVTSFASSIALAIGINPGAGALGGTSTKSAASGLTTYNDLTINKAGTGYTLVASSNGLTSATSDAFNISPNIATKLAFIVEPTDTVATNSMTPAPQVEVRDAYDNKVTGSSATIAMEIGFNAGNPSGTLSGTLSKNALSGISSYADLSINKVGSGYTLLATAANLTSATSIPFNITAADANRLVFTVQPSATVAGVSISPAVKVAVQDAEGNVILNSTVAITVAIANNAGGGTLSGTATVNAISGTATFSTLSINKSGVGYTLAATSGGLVSATSDPFTINPAAAAKLAFTVQPIETVAASPIIPAVKISVQDQFGNLIPDSTAEITVAIDTNPGAGTLSGTLIKNAASGVATFANLSIDKTGVGYTLGATSSNLTTATSTAFNITADTATKLVFIVQPSTTVAGVTISPSFTVEVQDVHGNKVSTAPDTITIGIDTNPGGGTLGGTKALAASSGVATFSTINIDKIGIGYKLNASAQGLTSATSQAFNITLAAAAKLAFTVQPINTMASSIMTPAVEVSVQDQFGNFISSAADSITLAIDTNPAIGALSGTKIIAASTGKSIFNNLSIDQVGTGYTLKATATGLTQAISDPFDITAGVPTKLVITTQPSNTVAGSALTLMVAIEDVSGNVVTSSSLTVTAAIETNPASGTLSGPKTSSAAQGVATFSTLSINKPGIGYTITVTSGNLTPATTTAFNIIVGPPAQFVWTAGNLSIQTNTCESYTVETQDLGGNTSAIGASSKEVVLTGQGSGKFYSDISCTTQLTKDGNANFYKTLASNSSSITFYYKAPFGGNRTFLADDGVGGLTAGTLNVSVANSMVLAADGSTTCVSINGALRCWGYNIYGQVGDGTTTNRHIPVQVIGMYQGVTQVDPGTQHTCAVQDGSAKCWGGAYVLGTGDSSIPVQVAGYTSGVSQVTSGDIMSCLLKNGAAFCWGSNNSNGFSPTGTNIVSGWPSYALSSPTQVYGLTSAVTSIDDRGRCAVHNGAAKCWGINSFGELGDGTTTGSNIPVQVSGLTSQVTQISTYPGYAAHACAVVNGGIKCWGNSNYQSGQIGDGTYNGRLTPVDVSGISSGSGATKLAAGGSFNCAIVNGAVKCWGANGSGQLGINDNTVATSNTPRQVSGLTSGIKNIAAGAAYACAVKADDSIWCWGGNAYGQLGDNSTTTRWAPVQVQGLAANVASSLIFITQPVNTQAGSFLNIQVAIQDGIGNTVTGASGDITLALYADPNRGESVLIGTKTQTTANGIANFIDLKIDQMGSGFTLIATSSTYFSSLSDPFNITGGAASKLAWDAAPSTIDASTCNKFTVKAKDASGNATNLDSDTAIVLSGVGSVGFYTDLICTSALSLNGSGYPITTISAGSHSVDVYLKDDAHENLNLQASATTLTSASLALKVSYASKITAGAYSACATINGALKCWGYNNSGQLGDNSTTHRSTATQVFGMNNGVTDAKTGGYSYNPHSCAVQYGSAKCWGSGGYFVLGTGDQNSSSIPVQVAGFTSGISRVSVGYNDFLTCLIQNGSAFCWGGNGYDNGSFFSNTGTNIINAYPNIISNPTQVYGLTSGVSELGGSRCAVHNEAAKCWGDNRSGIIGNGDKVSKNVPTQVSGLTTQVTQVTAISTHACAVVAGAVKCWGNNDSGNLGDGTLTERLTPVEVSGIYSGATKVSASSHVCALVNGGVKCWGSNNYGQLGNGTTVNSSTPVQVTGLTTGVKDIVVGFSHSCALKQDDTVWCWGRGTEGQLGNNSIANSYVPVQVQGLAVSAPSKLTWVQGAANNAVNTCSAMYQVSVQDSSGSPSPVSGSTLVTFTGKGSSTIYTDSACTTALPTDGSGNYTLTLPAGFAYSSPFYFKDGLSENINVTAASGGLTSSSKSISF